MGQNWGKKKSFCCVWYAMHVLVISCTIHYVVIPDSTADIEITP